MKYSDEICGFLSDNGIHCVIESICGCDAVYTGNDAVILPVSILAESMKEAQECSESLEKAAGQISSKSGKRPLIIPEDRWRRQGSMMRSRLLSHLEIFTQVYARNCEVRKIDKTTAAEFLQENHSYGDAACRFRYGLFLKRHTGHNAGTAGIPAGTLVAVATFSNPRKWIKGDRTIRSYEWTRYASLPDVRVSGGMGKLLKAFIEDVNPDDIMTYADLEWSEGMVYEKLGFVLEGFKEPVAFAVDAADWNRTALKGAMSLSSGIRYFQNLGSNKYRLKLTDYQ